jgi:transcriptional regulator with XRE-family HTH domain
MAKRPWVQSAAYQAAIAAIVERRKANSITQRGLAARLEKPQSFVSKIESRERRLDIIEFIAIARALGIEPRALLDEIIRAIPESLDF